jgi:hypothetical protein
MNNEELEAWFNSISPDNALPNETVLKCSSTKRQLEKKLRRKKLDMRSKMFVPNIKRRKNIDEDEIYLWMQAFTKGLNAPQMLRCDLLSLEERKSIKEGYKMHVDAVVKDFVMMLLYPYVTTDCNGKKRRQKYTLKEQNAMILDYINANLEQLNTYFNSENFRTFLNIINIYYSKICSMNDKLPTDHVIYLARENYYKEYYV